jgi:hypothetical protein
MVGDNHTAESPRKGQSVGTSAGDAGHAASAAWAGGCIDRLVTGDLDESERLELLAWLDAEPARWRRCGLAFLEAQALRDALTPGAAGELTLSSAGPPRAAGWRSPRLRWRPMLVAAAAIMAAFALGWTLGHRPPSPVDSGMSIAGNSPDESSAAASQTAASAGSTPAGTTLSPTPGGRVTLVRVRVGEGTDAREVMLPVLAGPATSVAWERTPGPVPDYVRRQWERQGYRVTERRQTVPLKLADGRQVELPVEQVMLTFVGQPVL